jgi:hypothetical protein
MRILIVVMLVAVLVALAGAGFFMLRRGKDGATGRNDRMARALAVRVGLSVALFVIIMLAWSLGWIRPTGIPVGV